MQQKLITIARFLFLALVFFIPLSVDLKAGVVPFGLTFPSEPLAALTGLYCLILFLRQRTFSFIDYSVAGVLIGTLVSSLFSSDLTVSIKYLLTIGTYASAGLFYFRISDNPQKDIRKTTSMYLTATSLLSLMCIVNAFRMGIFYETSYLIAQPFVMQGHSNLSIILEPSIILCTYIILQGEPNTKERLFLILVLLLNALALVFSCSRTSYITISIALGILVLLGSQFNIKKIALLISPFAIALMLWKGYDHYHFLKYQNDPNSYYNSQSKHYNEQDSKTYKPTNMVEELSEVSNFNNRAGKSSGERINRWSAGINYWKEHWITGIGPGTFADYYLKQTREQTEDFTQRLRVRKMNIHNLWLGWLVEGGVIVFILGLFFVGYLLKVIYGLNTYYNKIVAVVLIPFFSHSFVQDYWKEPRVIIFFWIVVGLIAYFNREQTTRVKSST